MQQNKRKHLFKLHCTVSTDNRQFSAIIPLRQLCQGLQDLEVAHQMRVGMSISEYFSWSTWIQGKYLGFFLLFKQLARVEILVLSILGRRWTCDEVPRKTRSSQSSSPSFTAQAEKSWAQKYKSTADAAETEMGKDVDENSFWVSGWEAWLPKGKVRTKWKSPGKGAPVFLLPFTSKSVSWEILLSPAPSPLWQENCQKGNKPSALEKTSRTGRKKTGPGESSTANEVESTETEWEFLFPSLLISVFMESSTTTGPVPLPGGVIYQNKQPPDWVWSGRVELLCLWNRHRALGTAAAPWETHWDLLGEISHFFPPEELDSNLPQPPTELGRRDHILMSH